MKILRDAKLPSLAIPYIILYIRKITMAILNGLSLALKAKANFEMQQKLPTADVLKASEVFFENFVVAFSKSFSAGMRKTKREVF